LRVRVAFVAGVGVGDAGAGGAGVLELGLELVVLDVGVRVYFVVMRVVVGRAFMRRAD